MSVRPFLFACVVLLCGLSSQAQDNKKAEVDPFNVPDELRSCVRAKPDLEISGDINPFYISGDYDGDGLTDFAVQVKDKKSGHLGVLFCFAKGGTALWGAGVPNNVLTSDNPWPFDSWMLIRKGSKHLSIYPHIKVDALALIIADQGGGLLYWDGKKLHWKQEE